MKHLLAISVGPVQELIAAARRTRDLWLGSHLLSEISRSVAKSVEAANGKLVFPQSSDAPNVANVILAELPSGIDPKGVAAEGEKAAEQQWMNFAVDAHRQATAIIRQNIWDEQAGDVVEYFAAWVPHHDAANYRDDRARVMRLLAGRKNCRDFEPAKGRAGVPKSSLDGQRESVLKPPKEWPIKFQHQLRIREGEQLDVIGVVKRIAEGDRPYPSVSRIAADPWIRGNKDELDSVIQACQTLEHSKVLRRIRASAQYDPTHFPFEGTAVYVDRHHELVEETGTTKEQLSDLRKAIMRLPLPNPYLAVLVADGDRMGSVISKLQSAEANRTFSKTLAKFASNATEIVKKHHGVSIYAGGDDVLAFLPVDKCVCCARELRDDFGAMLKEYDATLSVGIAIGHFMENLEDLLEYGRAAEKAAKPPDRNGLAVHLHKRGGAPVKTRNSWSNKPDERLLHFAELINDSTIPSKLPYELKQMSRVYEAWRDNGDQAIQKDLTRLIAKKTSRGKESVQQAMSDYLKEMTSSNLLALANEMLIARQIATAIKQASKLAKPVQGAAP